MNRWIHFIYSRYHILISQLNPVTPSGQMHLQVPILFWHVPPFLQGLLPLHSSTSESVHICTLDINQLLADFYCCVRKSHYPGKKPFFPMLTILTVFPFKSEDALAVIATDSIGTVTGVLARIVNALINIQTQRSGV